MNWTTSASDVRDGRSTRWDRHRQERRRELVRAARAAVHDLGPQASMEEIAAHAGTSKSVFYRYFEDRAGLRRAVAERVTAHLERRLAAAAATTPDGPDAVRAMVAACLDVAAASPHVYAFVVSEADAPAGSGVEGAVLTPFFDRVALTLQEGLARTLAAHGAVLERGSPLVLWPRGAVGMVRGVLEAWLATPEAARPGPAETAAAVAGWLVAGPSVALTASAAPSRSP